jgi:hypothetical protein
VKNCRGSGGTHHRFSNSVIKSERKTAERVGGHTTVSAIRSSIPREKPLSGRRHTTVSAIRSSIPRQKLPRGWGDTPPFQQFVRLHRRLGSLLTLPAVDALGSRRDRPPTWVVSAPDRHRRPIRQTHTSFQVKLEHRTGEHRQRPRKSISALVEIVGCLSVLRNSLETDEQVVLYTMQ